MTMSEHDARRLLQAAADTIEIEPAGPLDLPGTRRWPVLVAAAAAVLAVLLASTILAVRDRRPDPAGGPRPTPAPTPIGTVTVPSVLGYDESQATDLLAGLGLNVSVTRQAACPSPAGAALSTDPAAGSRMDPGGLVGLMVSDGPGPTAFCVTDHEAYDLLRFARGTGPAPAFADTVTLYVRGGATRALPTPQAEDPRNWNVCGATCVSPLKALVDAAGLTSRVNGTYEDPELSQGLMPSGPRCETGFPATLFDRESAAVDVTAPSMHGPCRPPLLRVFHDADRRIDAVYLSSNRPTGPEEEVAGELVVPPVLGLDAEAAVDQLTDLGFVVQPVVDETCGPPRGVAVSTDLPPGTTRTPGATVLLTVTGGTRPCDPDPDTGTAWTVLRFARGLGPAPEFADEVEVYDGTGRRATLTREEAGDADSWRCREDPCESPLGALAAEAERTWPIEGEPGAFGYPALISDMTTEPGNTDPCPSQEASGLDGGPALSIAVGVPEGEMTCPPVGVLAHRDAAGAIDAVALTRTVLPSGVGQPPATVTRAQRDVADAFVAFARGEAPAPIDGPVNVYVGHRYAAGLTAQQAATRRGWRVCPEGEESYAAYVCPVDLLGPLTGSSYALTATPPRLVCAPPTGRLPTGLATAPSIAIVPGAPDGCLSQASVQLFLDDQDRITAVDLELGEP